MTALAEVRRTGADRDTAERDGTGPGPWTRLLWGVFGRHDQPRRYVALGWVLGYSVVCLLAVVGTPWAGLLPTPAWTAFVAGAFVLAVSAGVDDAGVAGAVAVAGLPTAGLVGFGAVLDPAFSFTAAPLFGVLFSVAVGLAVGVTVGFAGLVVGAGARWVGRRTG